MDHCASWKSKKLWRSKIVTNVICHPSRSYIGVPEFSAFPSAKFLMDAKIIQPCAEGHLLSLQFLVTNYIFFLNKIMYSHFIFTKKILLCIWNFFSRENEIVDIFQGLYWKQNKLWWTNSSTTILHLKLKVWVFFCHFAQQVMFWNLSSLEKLLHIFLWHGKIWTLYTCC